MRGGSEFVWDKALTATNFLEETPDTATAATEVLGFAATGDAIFTLATVHVLDQTAFKLSLVCTRSEEEVKALIQVTTMLGRYRTNAIREAHGCSPGT